MSFDGWFKMNENDYGMDITFKSPDNSFKSLLSLVPGMYTSSFNNIETKGDLAFNGFAKGTYSEKQMPAFNLNLLVKDAMFKYPDLPTAINNINIDLLVDNKDGVIENTILNLKKFHLISVPILWMQRRLITKMYPTNVDAILLQSSISRNSAKCFRWKGWNEGQLCAQPDSKRCIRQPKENNSGDRCINVSRKWIC